MCNHDGKPRREGGKSCSCQTSRCVRANLAQRENIHGPSGRSIQSPFPPDSRFDREVVAQYGTTTHRGCARPTDVTKLDIRPPLIAALITQSKRRAVLQAG